MCVASEGMYSEGVSTFGGCIMFTGFRFTSLVAGLLGWPSYLYMVSMTEETSVGP